MEPKSSRGTHKGVEHITSSSKPTSSKTLTLNYLNFHQNFHQINQKLGVQRSPRKALHFSSKRLSQNQVGKRDQGGRIKGNEERRELWRIIRKKKEINVRQHRGVAGNVRRLPRTSWALKHSDICSKKWPFPQLPPGKPLGQQKKSTEL